MLEKNIHLQCERGFKQAYGHVFVRACVCVCPYVCNNCGMGVGCNHNQIESGLQYQLQLWFTFHSRGEKKEKQQKRRRRSWNEHLGKTCRCIKCQWWASLWRSAKYGATLTSTAITTTPLCLPLIKEKNNSDGGEDGPEWRYITCQLDEGRRQWGEMQTIWEAMWEATWPKGLTALTSTVLARLDLFEVLHNALNTTLFSFSLPSLSYLPSSSSPLALCFPLWDHNHKDRPQPRQTQPRIKSILRSYGATITA